MGHHKAAAAGYAFRFFLSSKHLGHEVRLSNERPSQGNHIHTGTQHLLHVPQGADAAHQAHGNIHLGPQPGSPFQIVEAPIPRLIDEVHPGQLHQLGPLSATGPTPK